MTSTSQSASHVIFNDNEPACHMQHLQNLFHELTKSQFISFLVSGHDAGDITLEQSRSIVFNAIKACQEYPFRQTCELKKRRPRRNRGESLNDKLAEDVYVLVSVLDGAPF